MVTYYVKKGEVYKVSATVKCDIYDSAGVSVATCAAGSIVTFNAPTVKITLSDGNAVLTCLSEVAGDVSGLSEHVNNQGIHVSSSEKSKWNTTTSGLSDVKNQIPDLEAHVESESIHVTNAERQNWNGKANGTHNHAISEITNLQTTLNGKANGTHNHAISDIANLQTTLNGKANSTHNHAISDITNLQTTLDGKASTAALNALDVGVKRIDYWTNEGEGTLIHSKSETLTDVSSFSDFKEYKATKDVCLIYTVGNSPGSGYADDFKGGFYYNYPLKMCMNVKVNGTYYACEAANRRVCSGGIDFIQVHLKAGDEVKFQTSSVSTYTGYVRIRLLEYNYR